MWHFVFRYAMWAIPDGRQRDRPPWCYLGASIQSWRTLYFYWGKLPNSQKDATFGARCLGLAVHEPLVRIRNVPLERNLRRPSAWFMSLQLWWDLFMGYWYIHFASCFATVIYYVLDCYFILWCNCYAFSLLFYKFHMKRGYCRQLEFWTRKGYNGDSYFAQLAMT